MSRKGPIEVRVKRVYEAPAPADGCRVLVDRIWPRGLSKEAAQLDAWLKDAAPSTELRKWFGHEESKWESFKRKYFAELEQRPELIEQFIEVCTRGTMTLLFAAKDAAHNNAVALKEYLSAQRAFKR